MTCKNCGFDGDGKYCSQCGQALQAVRIKLPAVIHEVIHTFTHFEKGFLYTVKQLSTHPGTAQKQFLDGHRIKHQKPFPMFVISGTICALVLYLLYKKSSLPTDEIFFKNYYVFTQASMLPFYALTTWALFFNYKLYYGEILVMTIYMVGFMSLLIIPINGLHFFFNNGIITLLEVTVLAVYNIWTYLNFFDHKPRWLIVVKSILLTVLNFTLFQVVANLLIKWLM